MLDSCPKASGFSLSVCMCAGLSLHSVAFYGHVLYLRRCVSVARPSRDGPVAGWEVFVWPADRSCFSLIPLVIESQTVKMCFTVTSEAWLVLTSGKRYLLEVTTVCLVPMTNSVYVRCMRGEKRLTAPLKCVAILYNLTWSKCDTQSANRPLNLPASVHSSEIGKLFLSFFSAGHDGKGSFGWCRYQDTVDGLNKHHNVRAADKSDVFVHRNENHAHVVMGGIYVNTFSLSFLRSPAVILFLSLCHTLADTHTHAKTNTGANSQPQQPTTEYDQWWVIFSHKMSKNIE